MAQHPATRWRILPPQSTPSNPPCHKGRLTGATLKDNQIRLEESLLKTLALTAANGQGRGMRIKSAASHLRPYVMLANRRTTINHMFAAAIAPNDVYDDSIVRSAVAMLGNDPDGDLSCAYCAAPAETWDHVFATVKNSSFSGHGHRLGNLLPCCKPCNSRKGNKSWQTHLDGLQLPEKVRLHRAETITRYLRSFGCVDEVIEDSPDRQRLDAIKSQILELIAEGDLVAARIRTQAKAYSKDY